MAGAVAPGGRSRRGAVAPPIDSLEEAIAAVGEADSSFLDFQPLDPNDIGASAWVEGKARGDSYWDLTFARVSGGCAADCVNRAYARIYVWWGRVRRAPLRVAGRRGGRRDSLLSAEGGTASVRSGSFPGRREEDVEGAVVWCWLE